MKMFHCFNFSAYIRFLVRVMIEANVNKSNKLNFSDISPYFQKRDREHFWGRWVYQD